MASNATNSSDCGGDGSVQAYSFITGVMLSILGSILINLGQNLQAKGLHNLSATLEENSLSKPWRSRMWSIGLSIFVFGSLINFGAFAFAPASVCVALETTQYVTNVLFNKFVNKVTISTRMYCGVFLALAGTVTAVASGPQGVFTFTVDELSGRWTTPLWWVYVVVAGGVCITSFLVHKSYRARVCVARARRALGTAAAMPWRKDTILPLTFALYSSQFAGIMIVQSKCFSELFEINACSQGSVNVWGTPFFWIVFVLLATFGCIWLYKMNEALGLFDPLLIIPLMQSMYIVFGVVGGGIYFGEFETMSNSPEWWKLIIFVFGILLLLGGLYLITPRDKSQADLPSGGRLSGTRPAAGDDRGDDVVEAQPVPSCASTVCGNGTADSSVTAPAVLIPMGSKLELDRKYGAAPEGVSVSLPPSPFADGSGAPRPADELTVHDLS